MPIANIPKTYADDLAGAGGDVVNPFSAPGTPAGMLPFTLAQIIQRSPAALRMIKKMMKPGMKAPEGIPAVFKHFQDIPEGMRGAPGFAEWDLLDDVNALTRAENHGMYVYPDYASRSGNTVIKEGDQLFSRGTTQNQDALETRFGQSLTPHLDALFARKGNMPPDVMNAIGRLSDRLREADPRVMAELDRAAKAQNMPNDRMFGLMEEVNALRNRINDPLTDLDPRLVGFEGLPLPAGLEEASGGLERYSGLMPIVRHNMGGVRHTPILDFR